MKRRLACLLSALAILTHAAAEPLPKMTHAVLVPGIWQPSWRCFGFLQSDLTRRGVRCLVPDLRPIDGRDGLTPMARQLKEQIDREFGEDQRFVVIAFSMGGLISRSYLQNLGGAGRCDALVTISTPHHGTEMAKFHYGRGAAEMRPGSGFLGELNRGDSVLEGIPVVSYRTPMDAVIVPSESSVWDLADNVSIDCPLHPLMTFSPVLRRDLLGRFTYPRDVPKASPSDPLAKPSQRPSRLGPRHR